MTVVITSREFNRDVSAAKRAAEAGPVVITDHGRRSHVLLTADDYDRLTGGEERFGGRLWSFDTSGIELDLPPRTVDERPLAL